MKAISAKTTYPNTPESDCKPRVLHDVALDDGFTVQVMSADPIMAVNIVNDMIKNQQTMMLK
jgi:hypothetical protein